MTSLRLAIVCDAQTPHDPIGEQARHLANHFAKLGHHVSLLCWLVPALGLDERVEVLSPDSPPRIPAWRLLRFVRWSRKTLRTLQPDRVVSLTPALPADVMVPCTGTFLGAIRATTRSNPTAAQRLCQYRRAVSPYGVLRRLFERRVIKHSQASDWIAISPAIAEQLGQAIEHEKSQIHTIQLAMSQHDDAINSAARLREQFARALAIDSAAYWITLPFVSPLAAGLEEVVRAFKPLVDSGADAVLLLAGRARYTHLAWIAQLGLRERVRFVGRCDDPERLLAASDLCVYPAVYDPGGWGIRPALSVGCAVIATTGCDLSEKVREQGGLVLDAPADPHELLEAMRSAVGNGLRNRDGTLSKPQKPGQQSLATAVESLL